MTWCNNSNTWSCSGLAVKYISDMLEPYKPSDALKLSNRVSLQVPKIRTKHGEATFHFCAANTWNSLPT